VSGGAVYRNSRERLRHAAEASGRYAHALADYESLCGESIGEVCALLAAQQRADGDELVVRSLLHLHCNRMGLGRADELAAYGVWRRVLDGAQHAGSPAGEPRYRQVTDQIAAR
jgi:hypothetical protein